MKTQTKHEKLMEQKPIFTVMMHRICSNVAHRTKLKRMLEHKRTENRHRRTGSQKARESNPGRFQVCRRSLASDGRHSNWRRQIGEVQRRSPDGYRHQYTHQPCTDRSHTFISNRYRTTCCTSKFAV